MKTKMKTDNTMYELEFDWNAGFDSDDTTPAVCCETPADALFKCLDDKGEVDLSYISAICGYDVDTVIRALKGAIYQDPLDYDGDKESGWVLSDEYLSGNVAYKLKLAKEYNEKFHGLFAGNVAALEALIEPDLNSDDIYFSLGSPWIPTEIIDEFLLHLVGEEKVNGKYSSWQFNEMSKPEYSVKHDDITGIWSIPHKGRFDGINYRKYGNVQRNVFGTSRIPMLHLLEDTLNMRTVVVRDSVWDSVSHKSKPVINREETAKAVERQDRMKEEFVSWVKQSNDRLAVLANAFNCRYRNVRKRIYDGSFLTFPGLSDEVTLFDYQKNAVARILFNKNTLLAHDVGAGKTYEMIAACMELKRTGKSAKNLIVVPNNILGQWRDTFLKMYPEADVLLVDNKNFNPQLKDETLRRIKEESHDAVIMASSSFDRLEMSKDFMIAKVKDELACLNKADNNLGYLYGVSHSSIGRRRTGYEKQLDDLYEDADKYNNNGLNFDDLGITALFVDEAHNYKNVEVRTSIIGINGLGGNAEKANKMVDKVRSVRNAGGRIIFATGTPITNSITDIFVMQKYLQENELEALGISNFDSWAGMFAEQKSSFEIDVDTSGYHLVTRFSKFRNVPELSTILSSVIDFHAAESEAKTSAFTGYDVSEGEGSDDFKDYMKEISARADLVRKGKVQRKDDNLLKITSDGRKAALDMRLICSNYKPCRNSKVERCADEVYKLYSATRATRSAQLVFCDFSTPKNGVFNIYDELKSLLIKRGIPEKEIAFVHDSTTDTARTKLFRAVNKGEIAVLIGSTPKLGVGVNVQKRLCALHHLDLPWRPADMVQREGRILRPGNTSDKVKIFRYITKGSFDAFSWQVLENKQRFIEQLLNGCLRKREGDDVDSLALSYANVKALAVGNPLMKERCETQALLDKYLLLQKAYADDMVSKTHQLSMIPSQIETINKLIEKADKDLPYASDAFAKLTALSDEERKQLASTIWNAVRNFANNSEDKKVGSIGGFDVVVPAHMTPRVDKVSKEASGSGKKAQVKIVYTIALCKEGRYSLNIESEKGIIARLAHFLAPYSAPGKGKAPKTIPSGLETIRSGFAGQIKELETRRAVLKDNLSTKGGYSDLINETEEKLSEIDSKLEEKAA